MQKKPVAQFGLLRKILVRGAVLEILSQSTNRTVGIWNILEVHKLKKVQVANPVYLLNKRPWYALLKWRFTVTKILLEVLKQFSVWVLRCVNLISKRSLLTSATDCWILLRLPVEDLCHQSPWCGCVGCSEVRHWPSLLPTSPIARHTLPLL